MSTLPSANVAYRTGNLMSTTIDAEGLAAELRMNIHGEVRFDEGSRALYATDGSNYRQVPIGVVIPRTAERISCRESRRLPAAEMAAPRHRAGPLPS